MWRRKLARATHAAIVSSRIQQQLILPLSNPILLKNPNSSASLFSPQILPLFTNPRFLSHQITDFDHDEFSPVDPVQNEALDQGTEEEQEEQQQEEQDEQQHDTHEVEEEKLETLLRLLQTDADGSLESSLYAVALTLHRDLVTRTIEAPSVLGGNLIRFIKWAWSEKSFKLTTPVVESLVLALCKGDLRKKEIYSLWDFVKDIGEKEEGVIDVRVLNELIGSFSRLGKGKAALEVFDKFEAFHCVPNADTYFFTIEALCKRRAFDYACGVCQKMVDARCVPGDGEKVGNLLCWLCKGEKAREAHAVYVVAKEEGKFPPIRSVNFLVAKLCGENETVPLAMEMLNDIPEEKRKRAIKPFLAVVRALCRIKDVDAAKQLVLKMIEGGPPPGNAVFNFVVTGYSKVGEMEQALEMIKLMESRGLKPDVYTYTVIASGYSNGGEMEKAMEILAEAKKKHVKLAPMMFHTLIRGYCKLEQFDKALELLSEMKDFGVSPSVDEYEKLIQSLCLKALDWETAERLHEEMKENGLHLKGITRALIRAVKEMDKEAAEAESIAAVA